MGHVTGTGQVTQNILDVRGPVVDSQNLMSPAKCGPGDPKHCLVCGTHYQVRASKLKLRWLSIIRLIYKPQVLFKRPQYEVLKSVKFIIIWNIFINTIYLQYYVSWIVIELSRLECENRIWRWIWFRIFFLIKECIN